MREVTFFLKKKKKNPHHNPFIMCSTQFNRCVIYSFICRFMAKPVHHSTIVQKQNTFNNKLYQLLFRDTKLADLQKSFAAS